MCLNCSRESASQPQEKGTLSNKALDDPAITHAPIVFMNDGIPIDGYLVRPIAQPRAPAVIVTHGNAALPEDMRNAAAQVAQAGFVGLLLDPTSRYPDLTKLSRDFLMSYGYIKLLLSDIQAAISYLSQQSFVESGGVGLVGFCGGGILNIMYAATHAGIRAIVAFYAAPRVAPDANSTTDPRPDMLSFVPQITAPLQWHCGTADEYIPPADVEDFVSALDRNQLSAEVYLYEGARHGFYHYTEPQHYDPVAAALAHQRMITFLQRHLGRDPV
jgi:carboxymethylenebutenolidase